jgi:hypothetical protein
MGPGRSLGGRRSSSCGSLNSHGSMLALPAPGDWAAGGSAYMQPSAAPWAVGVVQQQQQPLRNPFDDAEPRGEWVHF